jgi:hypothetical protein
MPGLSHFVSPAQAVEMMAVASFDALPAVLHLQFPTSSFTSSVFAARPLRAAARLALILIVLATFGQLEVSALLSDEKPSCRIVLQLYPNRADRIEWSQETLSGWEVCCDIVVPVSV